MVDKNNNLDAQEAKKSPVDQTAGSTMVVDMSSPDNAPIESTVKLIPELPVVEAGKDPVFLGQEGWEKVETPSASVRLREMPGKIWEQLFDDHDADQRPDGMPRSIQDNTAVRLGVKTFSRMGVGALAFALTEYVVARQLEGYNPTKNLDESAGFFKKTAYFFDAPLRDNTKLTHKIQSGISTVLSMGGNRIDALNAPYDKDGKISENDPPQSTNHATFGSNYVARLAGFWAMGVADNVTRSVIYATCDPAERIKYMKDPEEGLKPSNLDFDRIAKSITHKMVRIVLRDGGEDLTATNMPYLLSRELMAQLNGEDYAERSQRGRYENRSKKFRKLKLESMIKNQVFDHDFLQTIQDGVEPDPQALEAQYQKLKAAPDSVRNYYDALGEASENLPQPPNFTQYDLDYQVGFYIYNLVTKMHRDGYDAGEQVFANKLEKITEAENVPQPLQKAAAWLHSAITETGLEKHFGQEEKPKEAESPATPELPKSLTTRTMDALGQSTRYFTRTAMKVGLYMVPSTALFTRFGYYGNELTANDVGLERKEQNGGQRSTHEWYTYHRSGEDRERLPRIIRQKLAETISIDSPKSPFFINLKNPDIHSTTTTHYQESGLLDKIHDTLIDPHIFGSIRNKEKVRNAFYQAGENGLKENINNLASESGIALSDNELKALSEATTATFERNLYARRKERNHNIRDTAGNAMGRTIKRIGDKTGNLLADLNNRHGFLLQKNEEEITPTRLAEFLNIEEEKDLYRIAAGWSRAAGRYGPYMIGKQEFGRLVDKPEMDEVLDAGIDRAIEKASNAYGGVKKALQRIGRTGAVDITPEGEAPTVAVSQSSEPETMPGMEGLEHVKIIGQPAQKETAEKQEDPFKTFINEELDLTPVAPEKEMEANLAAKFKDHKSSERVIN